MDRGDSVTDWIQGLGTSRHEDASRLLWERYFARLARLAQGRLRGLARPCADGEDVALNAFDSFFRAAAAGRFERLESRDDLWRLLVTIASRKAHNLARDENSLKRGGLVDFRDPRALDEAVAAGPTPEFAAVVADESRRLFAALPDDSLRRVVGLKLEGHTNEEIAAALVCSLRTVERKLAVVRMIWTGPGDP